MSWSPTEVSVSFPREALTDDGEFVIRWQSTSANCLGLDGASSIEITAIGDQPITCETLAEVAAWVGWEAPYR